MTGAVERVRKQVEHFEAGGRPPPAPAGRQDRPGRPRPRPEGDRLGLCRSRLRRRYRPAVRNARGSRAPGGRKRRAHSRRVLARRRASDAGAGIESGAGETRPRRHHDRGRRRGAAAGLRRADEVRRRSHLPARHGDRRRRRETAQDAATTPGPRRKRRRSEAVFATSRRARRAGAGGCIDSAKPILTDAKPLLGQHLRLQLYSLDSKGVADGPGAGGVRLEGHPLRPRLRRHEGRPRLYRASVRERRLHRADPAEGPERQGRLRAAASLRRRRLSRRRHR